MRGNKYSLAALAVTGIVLAQLTGCSSCVKDDAPSGGGSAESTWSRRPMPLKAADKKLSQFSEDSGSPADASTD